MKKVEVCPIQRRAYIRTLGTYERVLVFLGIKQIRFRKRHGNHYVQEERINPYNPLSLLLLLGLVSFGIIAAFGGLLKELKEGAAEIFTFE